MNWLDLLQFRGRAREHAPVFENFCRVLASLLSANRGRRAPRIVDPFDWTRR